MMRSKPKYRRRIQQILWVAAILVAAQAVGQRVIEMRGFKFSEYYDAPQETRLKIRLEGAKAQPLEGGIVRVSMARLETFREDGLAGLIVEAPECEHNSTGRVIYSSGPLLVKTADGSFSIRGEGFLYQQTNSTLFISNKVETVADPELLSKAEESSPEEGGASGPMHISSETFHYSADEGAGLYSGNVQVSGTNLALQSGSLTLKLPIEERRLHEITASEDVQLDYAGMQSFGQNAIYNVDTEVAEVTGKPSWRSEGREGRAETFIIDRTNRIVLAKGNAWLRMPGQSLAAEMLPNMQAAEPNQPPSGPQAVEVRSSSYELLTNRIVFHDGVNVTEFVGNDAEGKLDCRQMTVTFTDTNSIDTLVARQDVVIERAESRFEAREAFYTGTNNLLELRGSPSWSAGSRNGKGDHIFVDGATREMRVDGNASMKMPASFLRQQAAEMNLKTEDTPSPEKPGEEWAEIFSQRYVVSSESAVFRGGVYITHPQMAWACERLAVELPQEGGHVERILAEQQVAFNFIDSSGQQIKGRGEIADYQFALVNGRTNEQVHLTGNPVIETTNGVFRNNVITYDFSANKLMARGKYSFRGTAPAMDTNAFKLPQ